MLFLTRRLVLAEPRDRPQEVVQSARFSFTLLLVVAGNWLKFDELLLRLRAQLCRIGRISHAYRLFWLKMRLLPTCIIRKANISVIKHTCAHAPDPRGS